MTAQPTESQPSAPQPLSTHYDVRRDAAGDRYLAPFVHGFDLTRIPLLNKGTAFTEAEREVLGLDGLIPPQVDTLDTLTDRVYRDYLKVGAPLDKHVFLRNLQDRNEVLFYALLSRHVEEMLPIVYTPTVGLAVQEFSRIYRVPRGLMLSTRTIARVNQALANVPLNDVRIIVATDSSAILGIGDQGFGGMGISIGKLSLYVVAGGVGPDKTLPVELGVGTGRQDLIDDPDYLGVRHPRLTGGEYDAFLDAFVEGGPGALPQGHHPVGGFLQGHRLPGAGALPQDGAELQRRHSGHRGRHALGRAAGLRRQGRAAARSGGRDSRRRGGRGGRGRRHPRGHAARGPDAGRGGPARAGARLARPAHRRPPPRRLQAPAGDAESRHRGLGRNRSAERGQGSPGHRAAGPQRSGWHLQRGRGAGGAGQRGPAHRVPAVEPHRQLRGAARRRAEVDGWPSPGRHRQSRSIRSSLASETYAIGQGNNAFIFPGLGFGAVLSGAREITDEMVLEAAYALTDYSAAAYPERLYPPVGELPNASIQVAVRVIEQALREGVAQEQGLAGLDRVALTQLVRAKFWRPEYLPFRLPEQD